MIKPEQKTRKITYWSCGRDVKGHYHSEEKFAARCIAKHSRNPWPSECKKKHERNKVIISKLVEGKTKAQIARELGATPSICQNVERTAMEICQSNPDGIYAPTWLTQDGRYTNSTRPELYVTMSLSLSEVRALVEMWKDNDWWVFLCGLTDEYRYRDGPALYELPDDEISRRVK